MAADVSPEGAPVRPAKGGALVRRPHQIPFLFPAMSGPTGQQFIFNPTRTVRQSSRDGQSGELLARWAEQGNTQQNITRDATDISGLRPSLDERLGLRPERLPVLLRGIKSPRSFCRAKGADSIDFAQRTRSVPDTSGSGKLLSDEDARFKPRRFSDERRAPVPVLSGRHRESAGSLARRESRLVPMRRRTPHRAQCRDWR